MSFGVASLVRKRRESGAGPSQPLWKKGWVELGERRFYADSRWEANYGRYLEWLRVRGEIADWRAKPRIYWFDGIRRGVTNNTPDFEVTESSGRKVLHEVKGWMDPRSRTRIKRMKKYHPEIEMLIIDERQMKDIRDKVGPLVPGWE